MGSATTSPATPPRGDDLRPRAARRRHAEPALAPSSTPTRSGAGTTRSAQRGSEASGRASGPVPRPAGRGSGGRRISGPADGQWSRPRMPRSTMQSMARLTGGFRGPVPLGHPRRSCRSGAAGTSRVPGALSWRRARHRPAPCGLARAGRALSWLRTLPGWRSPRLPRGRSQPVLPDAPQPNLLQQLVASDLFRKRLR